MAVVTLDLETYAEIPYALLAKLEAEVVRKNPLPDLETQLSLVRAKRNIKDPAKIKADIEKRKERVREEHIEAKATLEAKKLGVYDKAALSPLTGRVVSAALGVRDMGCDWEYDCVVAKSSDSERIVLRWLDDILDKTTPQCLITFNGRRFDIPFLIARMAVHGIEAKWRWPDAKYDKRHIDLLDHYDGKQDHWATLLTGAGKEEQGSSVAELVQSEDWAAIEAHNIEDVQLNALMYDRLCRVLKNLPEGDY